MKGDTYICGGKKFIYSGGYIGLPIEIGNIPDQVSVGGVSLQKKSSFHVSLLCVKNILINYSNLEEEILNFFCEFSEKHDISFEKYTGEFRFAESEERKTIVALCEVSNLKNFSRALGEKLDIKIPDQPTHITLYTLQSDMGIGLNSQEEMEKKSKAVNISDEIRQSL